MYQLTNERTPFIKLKVMILMDYVEGETLRDFMDN
jgi:hypothetical protein